MTFEARLQVIEYKTIRYEVPAASLSEMVKLAITAARDANPQAAEITVLEVNPRTEGETK